MTFDEALEEIKTESEENRAVIEEAERMYYICEQCGMIFLCKHFFCPKCCGYVIEKHDT